MCVQRDRILTSVSSIFICIIMASQKIFASWQLRVFLGKWTVSEYTAWTFRITNTTAISIDVRKLTLNLVIYILKINSKYISVTKLGENLHTEFPTWDCFGGGETISWQLTTCFFATIKLPLSDKCLNGPVKLWKLNVANRWFYMRLFKEFCIACIVWGKIKFNNS